MRHGVCGGRRGAGVGSFVAGGGGGGGAGCTATHRPGAPQLVRRGVACEGESKLLLYTFNNRKGGMRRHSYMTQHAEDARVVVTAVFRCH
jgi:hypothetical protein